jgi:hypothetical protein
MTCTIASGDNNCPVEPPPSGGGTQTIRAWIDGDQSNGIVEADTAEGPDQDTAPGDQPEPDGTDVMNWIWTHGDPPPPPCGADRVCWQRVTLNTNWGDTFFGRIYRESNSCGEVNLWIWKIRRGRDRLMYDMRVFPNPYGPTRWSAPLGKFAPRGRYYAVISKTLASIPNTEPPGYEVCARDRSRTERVP